MRTTNGSVWPQGQTCELYSSKSVSSLMTLGTNTKSTPLSMSHRTWPCATRIGKHGSATVSSTPAARMPRSLSGDSTAGSPGRANSVAQNGSLS